MKKKLPIVFIFTLFFKLLPNCLAACESQPTISPVFSSKSKDLKKKFEKKYGAYTNLEWNKNSILAFCKNGTTTFHQQLKHNLFSKRLMVPFIINQKCEVESIQYFSSKRMPNHQVLAEDKDIIGGGLFNCVQQNNNNLFYITNQSSRYCFPIESVKHLINQLHSIGFDLTNIYIKKSDAKFCANKKDRVQKIHSVINGNLIDFGYKKQHIYRADQFLKIDFTIEQ